MGVFSIPCYQIVYSPISKNPAKMTLYFTASSLSLPLLLTFATNVVKYICHHMANKSFEAVLHSPCTSSNFPFFSILCQIFSFSLNSSLTSTSSRSRFSRLTWTINISFPSPHLARSFQQAFFTFLFAIHIIMIFVPISIRPFLYTHLPSPAGH